MTLNIFLAIITILTLLMFAFLAGVKGERKYGHRARQLEHLGKDLVFWKNLYRATHEKLCQATAPPDSPYKHVIHELLLNIKRTCYNTRGITEIGKPDSRLIATCDHIETLADEALSYWNSKVEAVAPDEEKKIDEALGLTKITLRLHTDMVEQLRAEANDEGWAFPAYVRNIIDDRHTQFPIPKKGHEHAS